MKDTSIIIIIRIIAQTITLKWCKTRKSLSVQKKFATSKFTPPYMNKFIMVMLYQYKICEGGNIGNVFNRPFPQYY